MLNETFVTLYFISSASSMYLSCCFYELRVRVTRLQSRAFSVASFISISSLSASSPCFPFVFFRYCEDTCSRRKRKETVTKAPVQGPPEADEWDSEANDHESEDEAESVASLGQESEEDAHQEPQQGSVRSPRPFAVVIPPPPRAIKERITMQN
jgi:hypothetical protein